MTGVRDTQVVARQASYCMHKRYERQPLTEPLWIESGLSVVARLYILMLHYGLSGYKLITL